MIRYAPGDEIRAVVFDCDGVILESVRCKGDAFRRVFQDEPAHVDAIEAFHYAKGGMSRYEKFDHIYANILHRPLDDAERNRRADQFSAFVMEEILTCALVPGAVELLETLQARMPLFVASATPEGELNDILDRRGLAKYFVRMFGHPTRKAAAIRLVHDSTGLPVEQILFVGDATADVAAAEETGCRFIGRQPPDGTQPFAGKDVPVVTDCRQIVEWMG